MSSPYTEVRFANEKYNLLQLQEFLRHREALSFRILAISATDDDAEYRPVHPRTLITIAQADTAPDTPVEVMAYHTPAPPQVPDGRTLVCLGHCFLDGVLANVLVCR
jgi:hypothetical protein